MLGNKQWVLAVTEKKVLAAQVDIKKNKVTKSTILDRTSRDLSDIFNEIKKVTKAETFKLLLSDELVQFISINIPKKIKGERKRALISSEIESTLGTDISESFWGYKNKGENTTIVYYPNKELYAEMLEAVKNSGLTIKSVEPEVIALTRNENPIIGMVSEDLSSDPEEVEIVIDNKIAEPVQENKKLDGIRRKAPVFFKLALTIFLALFAVGSVYYFYQVRNSDGNTENLADSSVSEQAQPTPEPTASSEIFGVVVTEAVDLSGYSVEVLNGSGVPGEAAFVQDLLANRGFEDIQIGNADTQDQEVTQILIKQEAKEKLEDIIVDELSARYNLETIDAEDQDSDVTIIVGERK